MQDATMLSPFSSKSESSGLAFSTKSNASSKTTAEFKGTLERVRNDAREPHSSRVKPRAPAAPPVKNNDASTKTQDAKPVEETIEEMIISGSLHRATTDNAGENLQENAEVAVNSNQADTLISIEDLLLSIEDIVAQLSPEEQEQFETAMQEIEGLLAESVITDEVLSGVQAIVAGFAGTPLAFAFKQLLGPVEALQPIDFQDTNLKLELQARIKALALTQYMADEASVTTKLEADVAAGLLIDDAAASSPLAGNTVEEGEHVIALAQSDATKGDKNTSENAAKPTAAMKDTATTTETTKSNIPITLKPDAQASAVMVSQASLDTLPASGQVDQAAGALDTGILSESSIAVKSALSPAVRGFTVQTAVSPMVGNEDWGKAVGQKVLWLARQNISFAQLRLDPPDLGPMQVRIHMQNDQAQVSFISQQPMVREALEQSLLRLREMFEEQGIDLGNVNVSDNSHESNAENNEDSETHSGNALLTEDGEGVVGEQSLNEGSVALIDHYA